MVFCFKKGLREKKEGRRRWARDRPKTKAKDNWKRKEMWRAFLALPCLAFHFISGTMN
jgi:hypothetical protein